MFRPAELVWIEILIEENAAPRLFERVAHAGIMELQREAGRVQPFAADVAEEWRRRMQLLVSLKNRFRAFLATPRTDDVPVDLRWAATANAVPAIEASLNGWCDQAVPLIERRRQVQTELEELELLSACLQGLGDTPLELTRLRPRRFGPYVPWLALGPDTVVVDSPVAGDVIVQRYPLSDGRAVYLGITGRAELHEMERQLHGQGVRFARLPDWLYSGTAAAVQRDVDKRIRGLSREDTALAQRIDAANRTWRTAGHLWLLARHRWLAQTLDAAWQGKHFLLVTGWVSQRRMEELQTLLDATGSPYLFRAEAADGHGPAPVVLENPRWAKPFEFFVRGFGTLAHDEVDPSPILALVTPLMFGYMFGDVGQGTVLLTIGFLLGRRYPLLKLLVPGGAMAVVFGLLFGSFFCTEHLVTPLWRNPLADPLTVLVVPLALGAVLLAISLVFDGIGERWARRGERWWRRDLPLLLAFVATGCWFVAPAAGLTVAAAGLACATIAAGVYARPGGWRAVLIAPLLAWAQLLEAAIQAVINTLSFARVGAFALAHAGLASAVISLAALADSPVARVLILVAGNILIVALEGLIVSIQTTRLILFEFFRRFVRAEGRAFQPLRFDGAG